MIYLNKREVVVLHFLVMKKYGEGEHAGIKEEGLLESAVHRPQQTIFNEDAYPSIYEKSGAFFESLVKNHCFYNGNKRTAFLCLVIFLRKNGYRLTSDLSQNEEFTVQVAEGKMVLEDIVEWLLAYVEEI